MGLKKWCPFQGKGHGGCRAQLLCIQTPLCRDNQRPVAGYGTVKADLIWQKQTVGLVLLEELHLHEEICFIEDIS